MAGRPMGGRIKVLGDSCPETGSAAEFARALGVSVATVGNWVTSGAPAERLSNGRLRLKRGELLSWLDETGRMLEG